MAAEGTMASRRRVDEGGGRPRHSGAALSPVSLSFTGMYVSFALPPTSCAVVDI